MDANTDTFMKLAELGHSSASVAEAFMASYPDIRSSRQDLDDVAFKTHVMTTYDSFKRKLRQQGRLQKPKAQKKGATRSSGKLKEKQVQQVVIIEPAAEIEADDTDFIDLKPVATEPSIPAVVIPTSAGYPIPKAKDF